jgi:hypothetical protein
VVVTRGATKAVNYADEVVATVAQVEHKLQRCLSWLLASTFYLIHSDILLLLRLFRPEEPRWIRRIFRSLVFVDNVVSWTQATRFRLSSPGIKHKSHCWMHLQAIPGDIALHLSEVEPEVS